MKKDRAIKWTNENLRLEALKYKTRTEFSKYSRAAYMAAWKKGILDKICAHMNTKPRKKKGFWNDFENLKAAAIECQELHILREHSAYPHILKHPQKDEILSLVAYKIEHITDEVFVKRKQEIEKKYNLKCLENDFSGVDSKYKFQCLDCTYSWEAIWTNVYSGKSNCPQCAGLAKRTIEEIHSKARENGGVCNTEIYTNIKDLYEFTCSENHSFELEGQAVLYRNTWCPDCYENPLKGKYKNTIENIREIVEAKSGVLVSKKYVGMNQKYKIICAEGHPFSTLGSNLASGKWCPTCSGRGRDISYCQELAEQKDGECLEPIFLGMDVKHWWRCVNKDEWRAKPSKIAQGQWCPYCKHPNENFCRTILEQMLGIDFPKKRPKWLYELTGLRLELDGYNKESNIAFEYNGIQHYEFIGAFHKKNTCVVEQQNRDLLKKKACKKYGAILIVIPFFEEKWTILQRLEYLENMVLSLGLKINSSYFSLKKKNKLKFVSPEIEKLKEMISKKGGILKDKVYVDTMHPITVSCKKGHEWVTKAEYIKQGRWCNDCHMESIRKN